jgi:SAM-dependent methyltransferase
MLPQLYHAHHSLYLEDLPFWLDLAAQAGDPVLELGCGTGRVLIPLAVAGYQTVGLDHDLSMLKFLHTNIGPEIQHEPRLLAADIAEYNLTAQFPLIILPCNTFSMLSHDHRKACLRCVLRHLRQDGIFAVCLPNPELLIRLPNRSMTELEDEFIHPHTGNPVQVSSSWKRTKNTFNVTWNYDHLLPDGTVDRLTVNAIHQLTPLKTYVGDIEYAGLMVRELYGDFDRSAFTVDSPHLILLIST